MKKITILSLGVILLSLTTSCSYRSATTKWEDSKTAARYFGRGLKILVGGSAQSKLIHHSSEFKGPSEELDYVAMYDEEDSDDNYSHSFPLSKETPGEATSFLPGIEGFHRPTERESRVFQNLHFDTNRDSPRDIEDQRVIKEVAKFLKKNPDYFVFVEGHCDQRGAALYNMALGSRRSSSIRNALIEQGVSLDRLFTISYGKEKLLKEANNPSAWEENRRVQFKLYKKR